MSIYESIESINRDPLNKIDLFDKLSDIDAMLGQVSFDPLIAENHYELMDIDLEELEEKTDQIFIAADAGNPRARLIILHSAQHEVDFAEDTILAIPDPDITQHGNKLLRRRLLYKERKTSPIKDEDTLAVLDGSISIIDALVEANRLRKTWHSKKQSISSDTLW